MRRLERVTDLLGGRKILGKNLQSPLELIPLMREGLPYEALEALTKILGISVEFVASSLGLPVRTLARRKGSNRLDDRESERIVRLAVLFTHAMAALGSVRVAREWMTTGNRALGGEVPITLLDTDVGARAVEDVLLRIDHSVYG